MDKDRIKGMADQAKGAVKDATGKVTGDTKLQAEGKMIRSKARSKTPWAAPATRCGKPGTTKPASKEVLRRRSVARRSVFVCCER